MRVTVTGASGHVGGNLVRRLIADGHTVRASALSLGPALRGLPVEFMRADVRVRNDLDAVCADAEVVFHLAARISIIGAQGGRVWHTNVDGVRNVAEAALAAKVRRLVHCSSIHAFGLGLAVGQVDETSKRPDAHHPPYDRSKAAGEVELRRVIERGLDAVICNPTGIIGPYDFAPSRVGRMFLALAKRKMPGLVHGGFNWVDVRDVNDGLLRALVRGRTGENYILSGTWVTMQALGDAWAKICGVPAPRFVSPLWLARVGAVLPTLYGKLTGKEPLFTLEAMHALTAPHTMSHDKAARELGFAPRPLEESLTDIHAWFKNAGAIR